MEPNSEVNDARIAIEKLLNEANLKIEGTEEHALLDFEALTNGEDTRSSYPRDLNDTTQPEFVVRMRGLPWQATEEDITQFFISSNIIEDGIYIATNYQGKPTGEAFVRFYGEEDVKCALEQHKMNMGRRYIEVFRSSEADIERAQLRSGPTDLNGTYHLVVIRMRGLPFRASILDISNFFKGLEIVSNGIHIVTGPDGRATGEAYVEFAGEEQARKAMLLNRESMGNRYIELFRSSKSELLNIVNQPRYGSYMPPAYAPFHYANPHPHHPHHPHHPLGLGHGIMGLTQNTLGGMAGISLDSFPRPPNNFVIRMRGLPYSSTEQEIVNWFASENVVPKLVRIVFNSQNRPNGEAFVEFGSSDDCQQALVKHKQTMGPRYIELFTSNRHEMMSALGAPGSLHHPHHPPPPPNFIGSPHHPGIHADPALLHLQALHHHQQQQNAGLGHHPHHPQSHHEIMNLGWGNELGLGHMGSLLSAHDWNGNGVVGGKQNVGRGPIREMGVTLKLRGVPFRATAHDIMEFFGGYDIIKESIQFGQDSEGRASGECWVSFMNLDEANRALREKNRDHIGNRYIEIFWAGPKGMIPSKYETVY